ncbi:hypothetical protein YC2023_108812 [Brassica napus]
MSEALEITKISREKVSDPEEREKEDSDLKERRSRERRRVKKSEKGWIFGKLEQQGSFSYSFLVKHYGISQVLRKLWRLECLRLKDKLSIGEQHVRGRSYKAHSGLYGSISFTHNEEQEEPKKLQIFSVENAGFLFQKQRQLWIQLDLRWSNIRFLRSLSGYKTSIAQVMV